MPDGFPNKKEPAENVVKPRIFLHKAAKICTESGVYWVLKGVKSMIEVIYKEETDNKRKMQNVKLPNVRQIGVEIKGQKKYIWKTMSTPLKKIA